MIQKIKFSGFGNHLMDGVSILLVVASKIFCLFKVKFKAQPAMFHKCFLIFV